MKSLLFMKSLLQAVTARTCYADIAELPIPNQVRNEHFAVHCVALHTQTHGTANTALHTPHNRHTHTNIHFLSAPRPDTQNLEMRFASFSAIQARWEGDWGGAYWPKPKPVLTCLRFILDISQTRIAWHLEKTEECLRHPAFLDTPDYLRHTAKLRPSLDTP